MRASCTQAFTLNYWRLAFVSHRRRPSPRQMLEPAPHNVCQLCWNCQRSRRWRSRAIAGTMAGVEKWWGLYNSRRRLCLRLRDTRSVTSQCGLRLKPPGARRASISRIARTHAGKHARTLAPFEAPHRDSITTVYDSIRIICRASMGMRARGLHADGVPSPFACFTPFCIHSCISNSRPPRRRRRRHRR